MSDKLYGVKWHNFKFKLVEQKHMFDPPQPLAVPHLVNLTTDPHEREAYDLPYLHSWAVAHFSELIGAFKASVAKEPLIPADAPLDYVPKNKKGQ